MNGPRELVSEALALLGVERLVLAIHERSFPAGEDDIGIGTPGSAAGRRFLEWVSELGFTGVQLGPSGITSAADPSPYSGTVFARTLLGLAPSASASEELWGLVGPNDVERIVGGARSALVAADRVAYGAALEASAAVLEAAFGALRRRGAPVSLASALEAFRREHAPWLERDAAFEALAAEHGTHDWRRWPAPGALDDLPAASLRVDAVERFELGQLLAHAQQEKVLAHARALGLRLYGDLQIGVGFRDAWTWRELFLPGYWMGAPPSRTNPEGQPWGYPVLDPEHPRALEWVELRVEKMLGEVDGLRIDHPHGWVCPWVYSATAPDSLAAVQLGARLHESPDLPDHPALARYAFVGPHQISRDRVRWAEDWVRDLEPSQIDRYATFVDRIVQHIRGHGTGVSDLSFEVLSTCPLPLGAVLARHGLGRFRVTQKARLDDPRDVYRPENAAPSDWVMIGNHDTPPIRRLIEQWRHGPELEARARALAARLAPAPAREILASDRAMAEAMVADLFVGPARNVLIFFADLFGLTEIYNRPGVVHPDNWTLRAPPDFREFHARAVSRGEAPHLGRALALALRAKGLCEGEPGRSLAARLSAI